VRDVEDPAGYRHRKALNAFRSKLRTGGHGRSPGDRIRPPCATCMRRRTIPSPALVDLLLERAGGEVQGLRPAVRDALSRIANGLDASARDPDATDRADAVGRPAPS